MEQQPLYQQLINYNLNQDTSPPNALFSQLISTPLSVLVCPSDGLSSPAVVLDPLGEFNGTASNITGLSYAMTSYRGNTTASFAQAYITFDVGNITGIGLDGVILPRNWVLHSTGTPAAVTIVGITDGTSSTILFGEISNWSPSSWTSTGATAWGADYGYSNTSNAPFSLVANNSVWTGVGHERMLGSGYFPLNYQPNDLSTGSLFVAYEEAGPAYGSGHTAGANFVFCDGSVHFINNSINNASSVSTSIATAPLQGGYGTFPITVLQALCTRAGGEVVDPSQY